MTFLMVVAYCLLYTVTYTNCNTLGINLDFLQCDCEFISKVFGLPVVWPQEAQPNKLNCSDLFPFYQVHICCPYHSQDTSWPPTHTCDL